MKSVKINDNACGTWLEPYIGHEFAYIRETKEMVFFVIEYGNTGSGEAVSTEKENVDIIEK